MCANISKSIQKFNGFIFNRFEGSLDAACLQLNGVHGLFTQPYFSIYLRFNRCCFCCPLKSLLLHRVLCLHCFLAASWFEKIYIPPLPRMLTDQAGFPSHQNGALPQTKRSGIWQKRGCCRLATYTWPRHGSVVPNQ